MALSTTTGMTIRLPIALAEDLKLVADCDGGPIIDAIRTAISRYVDWRKTDPNFQEALKARIDRAQRLVSEVA